MPADNSRHLRAAAQRRAEQTRHRAVAALRRMDAAGTPVTLDGLAREASVSRSWLYTQHVQQADTGCDLDFLTGASGAEVGRDSH